MAIGADSVMFSVDYPYESTAEAVRGFEQTQLADADREKIAPATPSGSCGCDPDSPESADKEHQMSEEHPAPGADRGADRPHPKAMADSFGQQLRSPILHSPSEQNLDYQDVTFPALDGVPLEGWFIPAAGSDKLIIANHPMGFSRSGIPSTSSRGVDVGASGNDFEVNFVPDYKILHDAGYNVLAYDLRNFGLSGAANGGIASSGIFEARDVAGSLDYARSRLDTRDMTIGLFSRCLGCSSTFAAMTQFPEAFDGVRCLVGPQPVTMEDHHRGAGWPFSGYRPTGSTTSSSASSCAPASDSRSGPRRSGPGTSACPPSSTRCATTC